MNKIREFLVKSKTLKNSKKGFSLVEVLVGGIVLAICSMIMVSGFLTAVSYIRKGNEAREKGLAASSVIEGATDETIIKETETGVTMTFQIDSTTYEVEGNVETAYDETSKVGFSVFVPRN